MSAMHKSGCFVAVVFGVLLSCGPVLVCATSSTRLGKSVVSPVVSNIAKEEVVTDSASIPWMKALSPYLNKMKDKLTGHSGRRHIYIDMGANWANTLRLWYDVANHSTDLWEVYAFEASPLIAPYVEKFTRWLNNKGEKPKLTVPPAGSSHHLASYAKIYGCPSQDTGPEGEKMRVCMWEKFKAPLAELKPDPSLKSPKLVESRLAEAKHAAWRKNRYTFIPAAVSSQDGTLEMGKMDANQMIRGGAISAGTGRGQGTHESVQMIDVVSWMKSHFSEQDFVIVKMDVEGAEFSIMNSIIDQNSLGLMDVLLVECHKDAGNCPQFDGRIAEAAKESGTIVVDWKGSEYPSYDSFSIPNTYLPPLPAQE